MEKKNVSSLLQLCIATAIANLRYMGDVIDVDIYLLKEILPHCTLEQLMNIENSTEGRDLSEVTKEQWKKYYRIQLGDRSFNKRLQEIQGSRVELKWNNFLSVSHSTQPSNLSEKGPATSSKTEKPRGGYISAATRLGFDI